jgi:hypothetical protein
MKKYVVHRDTVCVLLEENVVVNFARLDKLSKLYFLFRNATELSILSYLYFAVAAEFIAIRH